MIINTNCYKYIAHTLAILSLFQFGVIVFIFQSRTSIHIVRSAINQNGEGFPSFSRRPPYIIDFEKSFAQTKRHHSAKQTNVQGNHIVNETRTSYANSSSGLSASMDKKQFSFIKKKEEALSRNENSVFTDRRNGGQLTIVKNSTSVSKNQEYLNSSKIISKEDTHNEDRLHNMSNKPLLIKHSVEKFTSGEKSSHINGDEKVREKILPVGQYKKQVSLEKKPLPENKYVGRLTSDKKSSFEEGKKEKQFALNKKPYILAETKNGRHNISSDEKQLSVGIKRENGSKNKKPSSDNKDNQLPRDKETFSKSAKTYSGSKNRKHLAFNKTLSYINKNESSGIKNREQLSTNKKQSAESENGQHEQVFIGKQSSESGNKRKLIPDEKASSGSQNEHPLSLEKKQSSPNQTIEHLSSTKKPPPVKKEEKLILRLATSNLPFKKSYKNASASFPHGTPSSLKDWMPSNDSYRYFQPMDNRDAWVYSAFWVAPAAGESQAIVRAFGFARKPIPWRIYCHYHVHQKNQIKFVTRPGFMKAFLDDHGASVNPYEMECKIPKEIPPPKIVSFTFKHKTMITNSLQIQYPAPRQRKFTVCYSAFHSNFNDTSRLIQSIHFNRILGAKGFVVYNFSMSRDTDIILRHYANQGLVTVLQWPLPTLEPWYLAQMVIINDCLYRNRNISEFVVFGDTDELIIPKNFDSWLDMIKAVERNRSMEEFPITQDHIKSKNVTKHSTKRNSESTSLHSNHSQSNDSHHVVRTILSLKFDEDASPLQSKSILYNETVVIRNSNQSFNDIHIKTQNKNTNNLDGSHVKKNHIESKDMRQHDESSNETNGNKRDILKTVNGSVGGTFRDLPAKLHLKIGAFSFRNAFFSYKRTKMWEKIKGNFSISKEEESFFKQCGMLPFIQYIRNDHVHFHKQRSKVIVRPEMVHTVGIHSVYKFVKGARDSFVRPGVALVQHYRSFNYKGSNTIDVSAFRFKKQFLSIAQDEFAKFKHLIH